MLPVLAHTIANGTNEIAREMRSTIVSADCEILKAMRRISEGGKPRIRTKCLLTADALIADDAPLSMLLRLTLAPIAADHFVPSAWTSIMFAVRRRGVSQT